MPKLQHANHASSFRHGQHHVQQITDLLGWPELVDPPVNGSYYNDAVDDHSASVAPTRALLAAPAADTDALTGSP